MTDDRVREIAPSDDLIAFAIKDSLGERCASFDPDCYTCQAWQQYDRAIASLPAPAEVPEGWKLVPVEPTDEILEAMYEAEWDAKYDGTQAPMVNAVYGAALAASPPLLQSASGFSGMDDAISELVIASRIVAFGDLSPDAIKGLDRASEAFAAIVPWDDEPNDDFVRNEVKP